MKAPMARRLAFPALLLALGLVLRLDGLAGNSFEQDELYTLEESRDLFETRLKPGIEARPLYYLIQHPLLEILPENEAGLRALPLVFGVIGLAAIWGLTASVFGPTAAAVGLGLTAISPWHLHASGMARYWSLVFLLAATSILLVFRGIASGRRVHLAGGALAVLLGVLTHPTFLFPIIGAGLGLRFTKDGGIGKVTLPPKRELLWLWTPLIVGLAAIALALRLSGNESAVQNWGGRGPEATLRLLPAIVEWTTPTLFAAGGLGALGCALWGTGVHRQWGMAAFGGMISGSALLLAASFRTDVYADYGISMLPLFIVSAAGGVGLVAERIQGRTALIAIAGVLVCAAGILPSTASHLMDGTRFDYRPAFRRIEQHAPDRLTLTWPIVIQRRYAPGLRAAEFSPNPNKLDSTLAMEREIWVVAPYKRHGLTMDSESRASRWLDTNCHRRGNWSAPRLDYRNYEVVLFDCSIHDGGTVAAPPRLGFPPSM